MSLYNKLARKYAVMPVLMRSESGFSESLPAGSTMSLPSVAQASLTAPTGQFIQQAPLDVVEPFTPTTPIAPTFTSSTSAIQRSEAPATPLSTPTSSLVGQPLTPSTQPNPVVQRAVPSSTTSTVQRSQVPTPPTAPTLAPPITSVQRSDTPASSPIVPDSEPTNNPSDDDRLSYILRKHQERIDSGQPIEKAEKTVSAPWLADALQKHERKIATKQLQRSTLTGEVGIARQEALQRAKERPRPSITYVSNNPSANTPPASTTPNISRSSLKESAPSISRQMSHEVANLTGQSVVGSQTPSTISRQAIDNPPLPIQRQGDVPEEEEVVARKPQSQVQRAAGGEEEEIQTKRVSQVQRQGDVPEEEEVVARKPQSQVQRAAGGEEEEIQTKRVSQVQRQGDVSEEEEVVARKPRQVQRAAGGEEEEIQTKRVSQVQRQGDVPEEEEVVARKAQPNSANTTWSLPTSNLAMPELPSSNVQRASVTPSTPAVSAPSMSQSLTTNSVAEQTNSVKVSLPPVEQPKTSATTQTEPEQPVATPAPFLGDGWKVQRTEDTTIADGGEPILELPSASQPLVDSSTTAHADVQRALNQVSTAKPTDAHVELVLPRRARPGTAQRSVQPTPPPTSPSQPTNSYMVSTDIGDLPSDLWTTLGEQPPSSPAPQRKTDEGSRPTPAVNTSSPIVQRTESNLIQESAPAIDNELNLDLESTTATQKQEEVKENESGETDQQSELFEVELARRVYQDIKRRLVVEKERSRGRF